MDGSIARPRNPRRLLAVVVGVVLVAAACTPEARQSPGGTGGPPGTPTTSAAAESTDRPALVERIRFSTTDSGYPSPFATNPRGPGVINSLFLFDTLLWKDATGEPIPWLASAWEMSADGLEWRFTLSDGVKWQDGQPLTADDVVFTFQYMTSGPGADTPVGIFGKVPLAEVTAEGDNVVVFKLDKPYAPFAVLVAGRVAIIPRHIWEGVTDPVKYLDPKAVIGSGPYKLESYDPATGAYAFVANEDYFLGVPYVRRLEFVQTGTLGGGANESDSLLALRQGAIDVGSPDNEEGTPPEALAPFRDSDRFEILEAPGEWNRALHFNLARGFPYDETRFRRAIAYAIDREDMVARLLFGRGVVGSAGGLAPSHVYAASGLPDYTVDPARANALLDEIGLKDANGDGVRDLPDGSPFTPELLTSTRFSTKTAEMIKEYLKKVGIEVSIKVLDSNGADAATSEGNYAMALIGYGGMGGDADTLRTRYASTVKAKSFSRALGYQNPAFDQLAAQQLTALDEASRKAAVEEMQRILAEDLPVLSLYVPTRTTIFDKNVFDASYYTPGGVFGGYPNVINKHVLITGRRTGT